MNPRHAPKNGGKLNPGAGGPRRRTFQEALVAPREESSPQQRPSGVEPPWRGVGLGPITDGGRKELHFPAAMAPVAKPAGNPGAPATVPGPAPTVAERNGGLPLPVPLPRAPLSTMSDSDIVAPRAREAAPGGSPAATHGGLPSAEAGRSPAAGAVGGKESAFLSMAAGSQRDPLPAPPPSTMSDSDIVDRCTRATGADGLAATVMPGEAKRALPAAAGEAAFGQAAAAGSHRDFSHAPLIPAPPATMSDTDIVDSFARPAKPDGSTVAEAGGGAAKPRAVAEGPGLAAGALPAVPDPRQNFVHAPIATMSDTDIVDAFGRRERPDGAGPAADIGGLTSMPPATAAVPGMASALPPAAAASARAAIANASDYSVSDTDIAGAFARSEKSGAPAAEDGGHGARAETPTPAEERMLELLERQVELLQEILHFSRDDEPMIVR